METSSESEKETENRSETEQEMETSSESEKETENRSETEQEMETSSESEKETENRSETEQEMETSSESEINTNILLENNKVFSICFPAINQFKFTLDPYGLKGLKEGQSVVLDELDSYAGKIYCDSKLMVTNKSSVPVSIKISIQLTGDVNVVESIEEVEVNDKNNVLMYIVPSENDLQDNLDSYRQPDKGIIVKKDEPTVVEFILPPSSYYYQKNIEDDFWKPIINDTEKGHSTAFRIAGWVNRGADWDCFKDKEKTIGLQICYSYEDASNNVIEHTVNEDFFGLVSHNSTEVDILTLY